LDGNSVWPIIIPLTWYTVWERRARSGATGYDYINANNAILPNKSVSKRLYYART